MPHQQISQYTHVFNTVCPETGDTCFSIMPQADNDAMNIFLQTLSEQQPKERIILCMDKASWHTTKQLKIPENITPWFLPPHSPELNPVKLIWRELKAKYFNNNVFDSLTQVDQQLESAIKHFAYDKEAIKKLTKVNYLY